MPSRLSLLCADPAIAPARSDERGTASAAGGSYPAPERHATIAQAAFFIAQARGFEPGCELDDWLAAEREVDRRCAPDAD